MFKKKKQAACAAILLAASSVFCACAQVKQDTAAISDNIADTEKSAGIEPDVTIKTKRVGILGIARGSSELMDANFESVEGDKDIIETLTGNLAEFPPYFNIIEP